MEKKKIAIINLRAKPIRGGQEATLNEIITGIKNDYEITYIGHKSDIDEENNVNIIEPFTKLFYLLPIKIGFSKILKIKILRVLFLKKIRIKCDLLIANGKSDYTVINNNLEYNSILIIKHGLFKEPYPDILIKNKKFKIVTLNEIERKDLIKIYGEKNLVTIRTGIKQKKNLNERFGEYRKINNINKDTFLIVSIGRLEDKQKNISLAIKSMHELAKIKINFIYIIIGNGKDKNYYQKLIKKLKLENFIKLVGRVSDEEKEEILKTANLLLITSKWETLGLTMVEAFNHDIPVLTTKTNGALDIIKDNYNGFFAEYDPNDIAKKIYYASDMPKEKLSILLKNAEKTSELFTYENMIISYKNVIESLIN